MQLDVPFLPDETYTAFLRDRMDHFHSVHFSLYAPEIADARHRMREISTDRIISMLQSLPGPKKYVLANSRFHLPERYFEPGVLRTVADKLRVLADAGVLDGITFADAYLLQALADTDSELAGRLEAVPSVNFMLDTFDKVRPVLNLIMATGFRLPAKLILDRSLNRRIKMLSEVSRRIRGDFPEIKIGLIANEGCLYQCPFKLTHDSHIALTHTGVSADTFEINRTYGCMRYMRERPHLLLSSPFIRPEDTHRYDGRIDLIKLCGRTLGPSFLMRAVDAYLNRSYPENLLDLMDTLAWMADEFDVRNADLPADFLDRMLTCPGTCRTCTVCQTLFEQHVSEKPVPLKDLRQQT